MLDAAAERARLFAARAAAQSPAYRALLAEQGIDMAQWRRTGRWSDLPILTKEATFGRFSLMELAGSGLDPADMADVLTSSGRGGKTLGFRLTGRKEHDRGWFGIDLGLQDAFDVDGKTTLLVNCLPMGVVFSSRAVTVANVSVREDMACAILRNVGPFYDQVIVCTDPLFILRLLDEGQAAGIDWNQLSASFILGEEMLVEAQREYLATRVGISTDFNGPRLVASSFGVGELGLNLLFETRESIQIRRHLRTNPTLQVALGLSGQCGVDLPAFFCFDPLRSFIEILQPDPAGWGEICISVISGRSVIPLPRYATGDIGRLVTEDELQTISTASGCSKPWLPVLMVWGRRSDRGSQKIPAVETVKSVIYGFPRIVERLTGAFKVFEGTSDRPTSIVIQSNQPLESLDDETRRTCLQMEKAFENLGYEGVKVELTGPREDSWGPKLDYERKFSYCAR